MKRAILSWFIVGILMGLIPSVHTSDAAQYTAFSLQVAQSRIEQGRGNWREKEKEVWTLGGQGTGINKVEGFVYDATSKDLILVGTHEEGRAELTLDDLVVALRARFRYNEWPLVSIDPTPETQKTQMQHIRFEGGIQETAFGQAMFEADYRLKQMGLGLEAPGISGLRTYWDRSVEEAESGASTGQQEVSSRFWFYPINPHVVVREGVCVVRGLKVGVFTEVLGAKIDGKPVEDLKVFKHPSSDAFAHDVSERFEDLCQPQPSFNRLRGLQELVAVSKALEELSSGSEGEASPDLTWWLEKYPLSPSNTPKEVKVLYRKYEGKRGGFEVSGGVRLTALAMRLKAGDVRALRDAVLQVRPSKEALTWGFVAAEWVIPLGPGQVRPEDIAPLFQQAVFLQKQERHADALPVYEEILRLEPRSAEAWCNKGAALGKLGRYEEDLECQNRALEINPHLDKAWCNKGVALRRLGRYEEDLECQNRALEINPHLTEAWYNKGLALESLGRHKEALSCYDHTLEINPRCAEAWRDKGRVLGRLSCFQEALPCFDRALEINPRDALAWYNKGVALGALGRYEEDLECQNRALEINPRDALAWYNKGNALVEIGRPQEALPCFDRALEINPRDAESWTNKGVTLGKLGRYEEALPCYDRALEINPRYADAWSHKGVDLGILGRTEGTLPCFDRALEINPRYADAWYNKGVALGKLGRYGEDLECQNRALEINPRDAMAWYNKGVALYHLMRYAEARKSFEQADALGFAKARKALEALRQQGY